MTIQVEFEIGGRTYRVAPNLYKWDIYAIRRMREDIVLTTDLISGDKIFVDWRSIPVMRLVSDDSEEEDLDEFDSLDDDDEV